MSREFKKLTEFDHATGSPSCTQSNTKAEHLVDMANRIMQKALKTGTDPHLGILDFHNTPHWRTGDIPSIVTNRDAATYSW